MPFGIRKKNSIEKIPDVIEPNELTEIDDEEVPDFQEIINQNKKNSELIEHQLKVIQELRKEINSENKLEETPQKTETSTPNTPEYTKVYQGIPKYTLEFVATQQESYFKNNKTGEKLDMMSAILEILNQVSK